jgi:hypothetical protein
MISFAPVGLLRGFGNAAFLSVALDPNGVGSGVKDDRSEGSKK